jgi:adenylate cyclase
MSLQSTDTETTAAAERRLVTVLFADVVDSTALAARMDPEDWSGAIRAVLALISNPVKRYGGTVASLMGDGLLAVFGAPERHADHAARAVAAARDIARLVREGVGGDLRVGLGVNSGRVVAGTIGGGGRRDFTVIGDPVNTAARVEAATRLTGDDVLITETTLRALGPHGDDFVERPSVPLKGKAATVRLYAPRPEPRA